MAIARGQVPISREDGHPAGPGKGPPSRCGEEGGFKMAPGARCRVDLVTSARSYST